MRATLSADTGTAWRDEWGLGKTMGYSISLGPRPRNSRSHGPNLIKTVVAVRIFGNSGYGVAGYAMTINFTV